MLAGTLLDNITAVVLEIEKRSWALTTLFFAHTFLSNFTLLNMLVGIIVQVAGGMQTKLSLHRAVIIRFSELFRKRLSTVRIQNVIIHD